MWFSFYFTGCNGLAWYCGKMYSGHLFSYGGLISLIQFATGGADIVINN